MVPATLKILKVLVEELLSASGNMQNVNAAGANDLPDDVSDDDDWEDDDNELDLGAGVTKAGKPLRSSLQTFPQRT